jgi:hypothetical protein
MDRRRISEALAEVELLCAGGLSPLLQASGACRAARGLASFDGAGLG